jgi:hypothetical protein
MKETYKKILENYNVVERVKEDLKTRSEKEALKEYKEELKSIRENWDEYTHSLKTMDDSLGQANICLLLKIKCIKKGYHKK